MPQFDVSSFSSQLFWLAIIFTILYFLVSKFIAPKAESILTARNRCLENNLQYAQEYNNKAKLLEITNKEQLLAVNDAVEYMLSEAINALNLDFEKRKEVIAQEIKQKQNDAMDDINRDIDKFRSSMDKPRLSLSSFIVEKITNKSADKNILSKMEKKIK